MTTPIGWPTRPAAVTMPRKASRPGWSAVQPADQAVDRVAAMSGSIRLDKPWLALDAAHVRGLGGQLGVYEIASVADDAVLRVGYAGGRSLFGLRGELQRELRERGDGVARFRVEVTMAYLTR